ncbi:MAG: PHB depolymerase family esterase [Candidatus Dormiibacterota bacterium]
MSDLSDAVEIGGLSRRYVVHVPSCPPASGRAVLVVLHGRRLTVPELRRITHFDAIADRHGFIVVYPEGHKLSWNDGRGYSPAAVEGIDDVGYLRTLIDRVVARSGADKSRVAVVGMSNGAVMCHRLGLELSDRITAIAAVSGLMPGRLASLSPTHAVSALLIHGSDDPIVPIDGGPPRSLYGRWTVWRLGGGPGKSEPVLSLAATAARWREIDNCQPQSYRDVLPAAGKDRTSVERVVSPGGRGGSEVATWIVMKGGHTWPGGPRLPTLGKTTSHFDAGEVIWEFVASHSSAAHQRLLADQLPARG